MGGFDCNNYSAFHHVDMGIMWPKSRSAYTGYLKRNRDTFVAKYKNRLKIENTAFQEKGEIHVPNLDLPQCYTVHELASMTNIKVHMIYQMIRSKELDCYKVGNKFLVPIENFKQCLERKKLC